MCKAQYPYISRLIAVLDKLSSGGILEIVFKKKEKLKLKNKRREIKIE